jgi:LPXTG-site transpeptidase (sortase) family protein
MDPVLIAEVTARALNMREGPGMGYSRTSVVQQGYRMTVVGRNAEGTWLQVCCVDGEKGWLSAIYVDLSQEVDGVVTSVDAPGPPATSTMRIVIPDLVIEAPVVEVGWQEVEVEGRRQMRWDVASFAAGHHSDSALPGQAGNDGVTMRSNALDGQSVYLYDSAGEVFEYVVEGMYKMPDHHVSEAQRQRNARFIAPTTEPILTLITCWPYNSNTHRIVVVARMAQ